MKVNTTKFHQICTHMWQKNAGFSTDFAFRVLFPFPEIPINSVFSLSAAMVRVVWYVFLVGIFALLGSMVNSYTPWISAYGPETSTQKIVVTDTQEASQDANPPTKPMPKIQNQMDSSTWLPSDVLAFMQRHPQRAYFSRCHFIHVKVCSWLLSCICIYLCIFWLNAGPLSLPWLSAEKCELSVAELSVLYW